MRETRAVWAARDSYWHVEKAALAAGLFGAVLGGAQDQDFSRQRERGAGALRPDRSIDPAVLPRAPSAITRW
jgi:hypothetical protein